VEATKHGALDFLSKPFTPNELLAIIEKALHVRWLRLEAARLREQRARDLLALSQERSQTQAIIQTMVDGLLVFNRDRQVVLANPAAGLLLECPGALTVGETLSSILPDHALTQFMDKVWETSPDEYAMMSEEISVGGDGERVLMANVAPVKDPEGEERGLTVVLRDISQLKAIDRMKSQFVSMVSHDLKSPLAAIEGYLDVILTGAAGEDPARTRQMLERCKDRAQSLQDLIRDLLDLTSLESGKISRRLEPVDLGDVVARVVELLSVTAKEKEIDLKIDAPGALSSVEADRREMEQVFTNLISNGIKYNRPGGGVTVTLRPEDGWVRVDVSDTGLGISRDDLAEIFDEFYRVRSEETSKISGTGLGLTIVKRIVEGHFGRLDAESELGKGSTFTVRLPLPEKD
jgi:PAS domain S-box-containing protein